MSLKPVSGTKLKYSRIIGTGGIGSGIFFSLTGNHTVGRNESRMGTLLPYKDFCKQHIIMHYVSVLLGAKPRGEFEAFPIGKVGDDRVGLELVDMMNAVGMDTTNVTTSAKSTLFSVCFQYPDKTGGNITTEDSASGDVSPDDIINFFETRKPEPGKEIILAVPEVPTATRIRLLEYGRNRNSLNIASVLSSEVEEFKTMGGVEMVDILAINIDEAKSIAGMEEDAETKAIIDACITALVTINPQIIVLITDGPVGSYTYFENRLTFTPVLDVPVISTAGAGDTFLAGTIAGLACGLPLAKAQTDKFFAQTPTEAAVELGTLLASLSVTSPDTIHSAANAETLLQFAKEHNVFFSQQFEKMFQD
jgi:sugar/nucleoside kinase (ribokinase family)